MFNIGPVTPVDFSQTLRVLETAVRCAVKVAKGELEAGEAVAEVVSEVVKTEREFPDPCRWGR